MWSSGLALLWSKEWVEENQGKRKFKPFQEELGLDNNMLDYLLKFGRVYSDALNLNIQITELRAKCPASVVVLIGKAAGKIAPVRQRALEELATGTSLSEEFALELFPREMQHRKANRSNAAIETQQLPDGESQYRKFVDTVQEIATSATRLLDRAAPQNLPAEWASLSDQLGGADEQCAPLIHFITSAFKSIADQASKPAPQPPPIPEELHELRGYGPLKLCIRRSEQMPERAMVEAIVTFGRHLSEHETARRITRGQT